MNEIERIWKEFGDNVKNVSIGFIDGKWRIEYKKGNDVLFVVRNEDMTEGAKNLLEWYKDSHTFRRAAENMWLLLDHIAKEFGNDSNEIYEICRERLQFISRNEDDELVWAAGYEDNVKLEPKQSSHVEEPKKDNTSWMTAASTLDTTAETVEIVPDGYPNYFTVISNDFTKTECFGYVNGERMRVVVNHADPKNSVIEATKPTMELKNVIGITESNFNSYYDEASAGIQSAIFNIQ